MLSFNLMRLKKRNIALLRISVYSFLILFFITGSISAQYETNVVKAAYLERITRFIEWPKLNGPKDSTVFTIGVYGDPDFLNVLTELFKTKNIKSHKVKVLPIADPDQIKVCDICYVSTKGKLQILKFVSVANEWGVLMMSEDEDFGNAGFHINFYVEEDKLKFEINKKSTDSGNFKISSLLLKSSRII
jgi:hypothetical protein